MNAKERSKLTLDQPANYQIKVPGMLAEGWSDWAGKATITIERDAGGHAVTILTGTYDQAALHGLLQWLYSMGLPLISAICTEFHNQE